MVTELGLIGLIKLEGEDVTDCEETSLAAVYNKMTAIASFRNKVKLPMT
jgi:hypothetical protein